MSHSLNKMSQNKYSTCAICKNSVKYNNSILKTTHNQNQTHKLNVLILCQLCFCDDDYLEITMDDNGNYPTIKIYMYDQKMYVNKKEFKKYTKTKTLSNQKNERKIKLINRLKELKIVYTKDKLCEQYILTGQPDLDVVVKSFFTKQNEENDRLCELLEELKDKNLEYNGLVPAYKKYIKKGGSLVKTIENGELEKILIKETNYLAVLENTDSDTAKDIAMTRASKNTNKFDKYIIKKNTIRFD